MLFNKVSYRRGLVEGIILFTLGRLCALISPLVFPDWTYVAAPMFFMFLEYVVPPIWAARRMTSTRRERLSKRFVFLGPLMAAWCLGIDLVISLGLGLAVNPFGGIQQGPALLRMLQGGPNHLTPGAFALAEVKTALTLLAFYTIAVICTRLAGGGFLRFTMPAGGNRVTL
ncbi:hypothetical protein [Ktedonobacter racemifer]|uniref:Uncharacterized protein n=1 Tax=Ktedonobacter racemifer DSM 44963 TaxID=485913 RepID=D6TGM2_KTERA|nr:hypothetical protein [Ktedonobacter racemifer]EFH90734.1 hypothetical protein Krac_12367 [Ktedonobacter racemifer DSM 44963]